MGLLALKLCCTLQLYTYGRLATHCMLLQAILEGTTLLHVIW